MAKRRRKGGPSTGEAIVSLLAALVAILFLLYLPLKGGKDGAKVLGIFGILGLMTCLIWWFATHENPTVALKVITGISGAVYLAALGLRIFGGAAGAVPVDTSRFALGRGESILYEAPARFLGEKRIRAFGGLGFRLGRGIGTGLGLSIPIPVTTVVDEGSLVVTNRRIILAGHKGTVAVRANKVFDVGIQGDYLMVRPEQGHVLVAELRDPSPAEMAVRSAVELSS